MSLNKKKKIAWICKFSNQEMIRYFGNYSISESSPWINQLIQLFRELEQVELHIIAPNVFTQKDLEIKKDGITYHFFRNQPLLIPKKLDHFIRWNYRTGFRKITKKVQNIVRKIQPDMLHLHGAENAYYSAVILPLLNKYKTLVTIQGFIMDSSTEGQDPYVRRKRIEFEREILSKVRYIGIDCDFMMDKIRQINPNAVFFKHQYPVKIPSVIKSKVTSTKKYDCVFFARISKDKGIEDIIKATSLIKNVKKEFSLKVVGSTDNKYFGYLKQLCIQLNVDQNIQFMGFYPTQELLFQEVIHAETSVLPTYHDTLPGTVVESMFMKVPVVAYDVGGLTELNKNGENILLVEKGNIEELASKILFLLDNKAFSEKLADHAYQTITKLIEPDAIVRDILSAYENILLKNS